MFDMPIIPYLLACPSKIESTLITYLYFMSFTQDVVSQLPKSETHNTRAKKIRIG
jgi:hypothetical protein